MADVEVRPSPIAGLGVFATAPIAAGALIRRYAIVRTVTPDTPLDPAAGEAIEHCTWVDGAMLLVDAPDRHFNHRCDPNAVKRFADGSIQLFARRDIGAGEEITHDYVMNVDGGSRWRCDCGAARCRGLVEASFFDLPDALLREYVDDLAPWFVALHGERVEALRTRLGLA